MLSLVEAARDLAYLAQGGGIYLIVDGIGSMIWYRKQHWYEHIPRVTRASLGIAFVIAGYVVSLFLS